MSGWHFNLHELEGHWRLGPVLSRKEQEEHPRRGALECRVRLDGIETRQRGSYPWAFHSFVDEIDSLTVQALVPEQHGGRARHVQLSTRQRCALLGAMGRFFSRSRPPCQALELNRRRSVATGMTWHAIRKDWPIRVTALCITGLSIGSVLLHRFGFIYIHQDLGVIILCLGFGGILILILAYAISPLICWPRQWTHRSELVRGTLDDLGVAGTTCDGKQVAFQWREIRKANVSGDCVMITTLHGTRVRLWCRGATMRAWILHQVRRSDAVHVPQRDDQQIIREYITYLADRHSVGLLPLADGDDSHMAQTTRGD